MRILVIGGTGLVGSHLVRRLSELGHDVLVAHTGEHEAGLPPEARHVNHPALRRVERRYPPDLVGRLRSLAPEVVVDGFPMTEADAQLAMRTFRGVARRVVAVGSMDVYRALAVLNRVEPGPPEPVPLTEASALRRTLFPFRGATPRRPDDPQRWHDDYENILVELAMLGDPALPGTVLRLSAVYGPGDYQHRLYPYLKRMDDRRPAIVLDGGLARRRWPRSYVENVAAAIALAATDDRAAGRVYNVAEPLAFPEAEWVRLVGRAAGWGGEVVVVPRERLPEPMRPRFDTDQHVVADSGRIRGELGYREPVALDEALRRTVAWESANPSELDPAQFAYATEDAVPNAPSPDR